MKQILLAMCLLFTLVVSSQTKEAEFKKKTEEIIKKSNGLIYKGSKLMDCSFNEKEI